MKYNFIIPYRNRKEHLDEFIRRFTEYLKDKDVDAQFYIIHQMNPKEFNRGAMNNIGFLEVCKTRPDGLFIFHDVDTYPTYWGSIDYNCNKGEFRRPVLNQGAENLGLICSCWKEEMEKTNGFANYWGWGSEDGALYFRAKRLGVNINQKNIIQYTDTRYVINHEHYRNVAVQHFNSAKNGTLLELEKKSNDNSNGISNIEYEVLSSFELAPRFTIINVDFKLKSES
jgi:hypothetical protein